MKFCSRSHLTYCSQNLLQQDWFRKKKYFNINTVPIKTNKMAIGRKRLFLVVGVFLCSFLILSHLFFESNKVTHISSKALEASEVKDLVEKYVIEELNKINHEEDTKNAILEGNEPAQAAQAPQAAQAEQDKEKDDTIAKKSDTLKFARNKAQEVLQTTDATSTEFTTTTETTTTTTTTTAPSLDKSSRKSVNRKKSAHVARENSSALKDSNAPPLKEYVDLLLSKIKRRQKEQLLPTCKQPQDNFVYLKNHKCASDTMSAVFRRYGYTRNLSLVQPVGMHWNIGWPHTLTPVMHRPGATGDNFNILTEHTVHNESYFKKIMRPEAVYISSIREPFSHLRSAFYFFGMPQVKNFVPFDSRGDMIKQFLQAKDRWNEVYMSTDNKIMRPCIYPHFSVTRNMMSFDLGLPTGFLPGTRDEQTNVAYILQWLEYLDGKYDMVMLVEYFTESLVMLKRMMCWTAKDVIYLKLNARRNSNTPKVAYDQKLIDDFLRWTLPDTLLYAHFNRTFWERVDVMGADDFMEEVDNLNSILDQTITYCQTNPSSKILGFKATKWNGLLEITPQDCSLIMSESGVRQELRDRYDEATNNLPQPVGPIPGC